MDNRFGTRSKRAIAFVAVLLVLVGAIGILARPAWAAATYTVKLLYVPDSGPEDAQEVARKEGVTEFPCKWEGDEAEAVDKSIQTILDDDATITHVNDISVESAQTTSTIAEFSTENGVVSQGLQVEVVTVKEQFITAADVDGKVDETGKKVEATVKDEDGEPIASAILSYAVVGEDDSTIDKDGQPIQENDILSVDKSTGALTFKKAGTATVRVTAAKSDEYAEATKDVTVTVKAVVSFDANGGEGTMDPIEVDGTEITLPANTFERDGYVFTEWQDSVDPSKTYADEGKITTDTNVTLKAQWTELYTVEVTASQGGVATANSTEAIAGTTINLTATPSEGYTFKGWSTTTPDVVISDTTAQETTFVMPGSDVTVQADFEPIPEVTLSFDANGGTGTMDPITVENKGDRVKLPANSFTRAGYTFETWNTKPDGSGTTIRDAATVTVNASVTLYAQWGTPTTVTLAFEKNANDAKGSMDKVEAQKGTSVKLPANAFTREGYAFMGWNTDPKGKGTSYKNAGSITLDGDTTLYAQWTVSKKSTITITFDKNDEGATGEMESISGTTKEWNATKQRWQWSTELPKNEFKLVGHDFVGWNTKADGSGTPLKNGAKVAIRASVTLYAQWEIAEPVTVTFDANADDTEGEMDDISVEKGAKAKLAANSFTRTGYVFLNWNTKADGSGTTIKDEATVTVNASVTLYAQWGTITVSFDKNASNAKGKMDSITVDNKGDKVKLPANAFTRAGYTFETWNTKPDGSGTTVHDGATVTVRASVTLYAQWGAPTTVTLTFEKNADDAKGSMDKVEVQKGTSVKLPVNAFTREGYAFMGWNTKADGSGASFSDGTSVKVNASATLYAQWQKGGTPIKPGYVRLTFDKNADDATGEMDYVEVEKGSSVTLPANTFVRSGHYFKSWNTKADGSGVSLRNGASVKINASATLYAQWAEGEDPNPGGSSADPSGGDSSSADASPANAYGDKAPVMSTSVGGQLMSRTTEVTYMISQQISGDATSIRMWFDLENVMQYTTGADQVTVRVKDGEGLSPMVDIQGQTLSWYKADDEVANLRGKTVQIIFKAKVIDGVGLDDYVTGSGSVAEIPYYSTTEFNNAGSERTVESDEKVIKISLGRTSDGSNSNSSSGSSTSNSTTRSTTRSTTSATGSSTAKKTPSTGDATSVVGMLAAGVSGLGVAFAGLRRRKR